MGGGQHGIALVDDGKARRCGRERGVSVHGSLWLIARGLTAGTIDEAACGEIVTGLLENDARFPFRDAKAFFVWARSEGLIPG